MSSHLILNNRVEYFRSLKGFSQKDLAEVVGSSVVTIKAIEHGEVYPSVFLGGLLCYALDCSFSDLFYFDLIE